MNDVIEKLLEGRGVRPTANRILVVRELLKASRPVSLANLEESLEYSMDKASIFRVLNLFSEKDIVHVIEDGSRSLKYELCVSDGHHTLSDEHVHFYCERCRETYCFKDVTIPGINLPEGFRVHSVNYMIKGVCPECRRE